MFGLDPFNPAVAIAEMLLLLGGAAGLGWLLGQLVQAGRLRALRRAVAAKEAEVATYRQPKPPAPEPPPVPAKSPLPGSAFDRLVPFHTEPQPPVVKPAAQPVANQSGAPVVRPSAPAPAVPLRPAGSLPPATSEADVLNRIAARAPELNFDRIGRAQPADADDLKDITGIGPFLERKLHSLGIYTYRQIANFTPEDARQVNELTEFFPGRIERDDWVGQAQVLHARKHAGR